MAPNEIKTRNIKFCAYLRMFKTHPTKIVKIGKGRAEYHYENISAEDWEKLKQDFDKSDFIEYGNCLDAIKDLAY